MVEIQASFRKGQVTVSRVETSSDGKEREGQEV
jgi:hypothetical protein